MLTDRVAAAMVLIRRGMIEPLRPDRAVRAARAVRRYGALGGMIRYAAVRHGTAPALVDDDGAVNFTELEAASNALAWGCSPRGSAPAR